MFVVDEDKLSEAHDYLNFLLNKTQNVTANYVELPPVKAIEIKQINADKGYLTVIFTFANDGGRAVLTQKYCSETLTIDTNGPDYNEIVIYSE